MSEPRIALWHPDFAADPDVNSDEVVRLTSLLGPFLETFKSLTVDDYWTLSVSEHSAMLEWLYLSGVLNRPDPDGGAGVREPRRPRPLAPVDGVDERMPVA